MRLKVGLLAAVTLAAVACGSDAVDENADASASTTTEAGPITEATDDALDVRALVEALAADEMNGRDNLTPGSSAAQELLVGELRQFAEPAFPDAAGDDGYLQPFDTGTNVLAVIPGGELADEFVMIGAHYDHLGNDCGGVSEGDDICNGATDNAAGVAAAMEVARAVTADGAPDRSVVVALWDAEEDGLEGSGHYVNDPAVPLDQTVAYLNFDNVGTNLLPSLAGTTILIGAETGGSGLVEAAARATEASTLDTVVLSLLFGQGRSDHAVLVSAGVPSVFFSDATSGCYHTVEDDVDVVDFAKLDQQIATATALGRELAATTDVPVFDADAAPSTYDDATGLLAIVALAEPDFELFPPGQQMPIQQYLVDLQGIVDAGPAAFDEAANATLLGGAVDVVSALTEVTCDAFIR